MRWAGLFRRRPVKRPDGSCVGSGEAKGRGMRLVLAILSLATAKTSHGVAAWEAHATAVDNAALAGLVAGATYKLLHVIF